MVDRALTRLQRLQKMELLGTILYLALLPQLAVDTAEVMREGWEQMAVTVDQAVGAAQ
jgi:hypothetical protein